MRLDQKSYLASRTFERSSYPIDSFLQVVDFSTDFRSNRINPHRKYDHPELEERHFLVRTPDERDPAGLAISGYP
ncbi:hypothetical protein LP414_06065 [Polaromonas sp. P1(28)-13]|nr:hypothetical protein LP414_06065 [Polaromonas sp. P1(28)-13]